MTSDDQFAIIALIVVVVVFMGLLLRASEKGNQRARAHAREREEELRREAERRAAENAEAERIEEQRTRERAEAQRIARTWEVMSQAEREALPLERRVEMLDIWERVRGGKEKSPPQPEARAEEENAAAAAHDRSTSPEPARGASAWWPSSGGGTALMVLWLGIAALSGLVYPELRAAEAGVRATDPGIAPRLYNAFWTAGSVYLVTVFARWLMLSAARAGARERRP